MDSNIQSEVLKNKHKELHSNVRHITQLAMSWFAFFVTVNYVAMSWLSTGASKAGVNPIIVQKIAWVFIIQNGLGVFGLTWVLVTAKALKRQVGEFENPVPIRIESSRKEKKDKDASAKFSKRGKVVWTFKKLKFRALKKMRSESIPNHLYVVIGTFLIVVLISLMWSWITIKEHYGSLPAVKPVVEERCPPAS
jgi:hypothetical protein